MRVGAAYVVSILLFVHPVFSQSGSASSGSIRADVSTKGINGEPAVLPDVLIALQGPITEESESAAKEAFAVDGLRPGTYQVGANASCLYTALAVEVSPATSPTVPVEMNVAAVGSTTSSPLARLKAVDCAFRRKVYHA